MHVAASANVEEPFGLVTLVNSTIRHCSMPAGLHFHLVAPLELRHRLRLVLESLFPAASFRMYTLDIGGARSKIVRHLHRGEREPVLLSPYRYALPYLPLLLPTHIRRVLWVHADTLIFGNVASLLIDTSLDGAPAAASEDCTCLAAVRFNDSHPALRGAVPAGACSLHLSLVLVDLLQWSLLDMAARVEYWQSLNLRSVRCVRKVDVGHVRRAGR